MVKGVNKTIIEINDTGNMMFEKVILFVSPKYGNMSTRRLTDEAEDLIGKYELGRDSYCTVRQRYKARRKRAVGVISGLLVAAAAVTLFIIF